MRAKSGCLLQKNNDICVLLLLFSSSIHQQGEFDHHECWAFLPVRARLTFVRKHLVWRTLEYEASVECCLNVFHLEMVVASLSESSRPTDCHYASQVCPKQVAVVEASDHRVGWSMPGMSEVDHHHHHHQREDRHLDELELRNHPVPRDSDQKCWHWMREWSVRPPVISCWRYDWALLQRLVEVLVGWCSAWVQKIAWRMCSQWRERFARSEFAVACMD